MGHCEDGNEVEHRFIISIINRGGSMTAHPPPVPPDQRPTAGPKDDGKTSVAGSSGTGSANGNLAEQGQAGNTKQNTTNKGFQQDR
jgi:hypothetical protein